MPEDQAPAGDLRQLSTKLDRVIRLQETTLIFLGVILSEQENIDADTQAILTAVTDLGTAADAIKTEIANLQAQGVDTSGLDAAVASLDGAVSSVASIATPPEPPPAP